MDLAEVRAWGRPPDVVTRRSVRALGAWIFLGLCARLALALGTLGTNDVLSWQVFLEALRSSNWVGIYHLLPTYNHPPPMSLYLMAIGPWVNSVPNGFPFLLRLPACLADVGSSLLVYRLGMAFYGDRFAAAAAVWVALSPVLVLASGFHGNTDPVFVFLVLWAAERWLLGGWRFGAGLVLGLSLGIKIVPVIFFPLFFLWIPCTRDRVRAFVGVAAALAAVFGYHAWVDFPILYRNVLSYDSAAGLWGLTQVPHLLGLWREEWKLPLKALLLAALIGVAWKGTRRRGDPKALLEALGMTVLTFLVFSPGFGIQYLSWLVAPSVFLGLTKDGLRFQAVGGLLMLSAYNHWCHGDPMGRVAGSVWWNPWEGLLVLVLWGVTVTWWWRRIRE